MLLTILRLHMLIVYTSNRRLEADFAGFELNYVISDQIFLIQKCRDIADQEICAIIEIRIEVSNFMWGGLVHLYILRGKIRERKEIKPKALILKNLHYSTSHRSTNLIPNSKRSTNHILKFLKEFSAQ